MNLDFDRTCKLCSELSSEVARTGYITVDEAVRREVETKASIVLQELQNLKCMSVASRDENLANAYLSLECGVRSYIWEMQMWNELREHSPDAAWESLVHAQDCVSASMRAHLIGECMEEWGGRLFGFEFLFPPQLYNSAGFVAIETECSICAGRYSECVHIAGRAYWGAFCTAVIRKSRLLEVSFVDVPDDKKCRVTKMSNGVVEWSSMTLLRVPLPIDQVARQDSNAISYSGYAIRY